MWVADRLDIGDKQMLSETLNVLRREYRRKGV
jgi:hypothetical protein